MDVGAEGCYIVTLLPSHSSRDITFAKAVLSYI